MRNIDKTVSILSGEDHIAKSVFEMNIFAFYEFRVYGSLNPQATYL